MARFFPASKSTWCVVCVFFVGFYFVFKVLLVGVFVFPSSPLSAQVVTPSASDPTALPARLLSKGLGC